MHICIIACKPESATSSSFCSHGSGREHERSVPTSCIPKPSSANAAMQFESRVKQHVPHWNSTIKGPHAAHAATAAASTGQWTGYSNMHAAIWMRNSKASLELCVLR